MDDDKLLAALARLETGQEALGARLGRLDARIDGIDTRLGRLETGQTRLRTDLGASLERMNDKMTALTEHTVLALGAVEHARRTAEHARDEGRDLFGLVTTLQRQIIALTTRLDNLENRAS